MKRHHFNLVLSCAVLFGLLCTVGASATDVATKPLKADVLVKPNVIFGMDDSGSMDSEVMLNNNDGAFWWDADAASGWDSSGRTHFNAAGNSSAQWKKMVYLFPNGGGVGERKYGDADHDHFAIPPTSQFAFLRSSAYNPLYYNPAVTYRPWAAAYVQGSLRSFSNAAPTAARSHPILGSSSFDLRTDRTLNTNWNHTFTALPGMVVPEGARVCDPGNCTWSAVTSATTIGPNTRSRVAMAYYAATYYVPDANCTVDSITCVRAPDGARLRRYEIKAGNTFPSGRSYEVELQNFANWFQYYRKRKLMLASSMGSVLENLTGMRLGAVAFNNRGTVTMYDADATNANANRLRIAGFFYENDGNGGTPTRETLEHIGRQFMNTSGIVQYACQRNAAFIVTDGFATVSQVTPPPYDASMYGSGAPYQTTYPYSLADIALSYYTNNLRPTLTTGRVPVTAADTNPNLHMKTYGLTLGARGVLYNGSSSVAPADPGVWVNPTQTRHPSSIDDLWHATLNGRGKMYLATNPSETAAGIYAGLNDVLNQVGAQSAVAVSSINLRGDDNKAYLGKYNPAGWTGDVTANAINAHTAEISTTNTWSAAQRLAARDWTTRIITSHNGNGGVAFTADAVGSVVNANNAYGDTAQVIDYLRGDRSREGATFRTRGSLIGAVINARPVVSRADKVVYFASSEGMVHAVDADTGEELWAHVPYNVLGELGASTQRTWSFEALLDGSATLATIDSRKILVGGRGAGGSGFYALDVTQPRGLSTAERAQKVLWEFPRASDSATLKSQLGLSVGKPLVVNTASHGWVVLLTSGYNSTYDGRGRVFMLNALSGELIHTFHTPDGSAGTDMGLAQISALQGDNGYVQYVYGGDEQGNVWRFDLEQQNAPHRVARLRDANDNPQPVTAPPQLANINGQRVIFVGTGRLLGLSDMGSNSVQTFYAITDGNYLPNVRNVLLPRTLGPVDSSGTISTIEGQAINWSTDRGWYVDLPAGQQANTMASLAFSRLVFTTNKASMSNCSASSYLYAIDVSGLMTTDIQQQGFVMTMLDANTSSSSPELVTTDPRQRSPGGPECRGMKALMQMGDGSTKIKCVPVDMQVTPRKNGWRLIRRGASS